MFRVGHGLERSSHHATTFPKWFSANFSRDMNTTLAVSDNKKEDFLRFSACKLNAFGNGGFRRAKTITV
jgi:hypothetical protein